jgi:hypothetical protein
VVTEILTAAGFEVDAFTDVHEPVCYGAAAADMALGLRSSRELLSTMDPAAASRARERVHALLAAHETEEGVLLDSRAWIITAHRPLGSRWRVVSGDGR